MAQEQERRILRAVGTTLRGGQRLSHVSAARWYRLPLPSDADHRIHLTSGAGECQVRRRNCVGHRDSGARSVEVEGVSVSDPEQTFLELAGGLRLDDLIAVGDHLVHRPRYPVRDRPFTTVEALREAAARPNARGGPAARLALEWVRPGVESPMETALRLLLVRAGLPEPVCGYELIDGDGRTVGWFDMAWPEQCVLGEYDGDQHRTSDEQYEKDIRRFDRAAELGRRVIRVRKAGMRREERDETIRRFASALGVGSVRIGRRFGG